MSELDIALLRAVLAGAAVASSIEFERRLGEIPNLVPLLASVLGLALGVSLGIPFDSLGAACLLGVPAFVAYRAGHLRPDVAKYAVGLGACLGLVSAACTLALGIVWGVGLARRRAAWKRAGRPMPRLAHAPRIAVFVGLGVLAHLALAVLVSA